MPKPILAMITTIRAKARMTHHMNSANNIAPGTAKSQYNKQTLVNYLHASEQQSTDFSVNSQACQLAEKFYICRCF